MLPNSNKWQNCREPSRFAGAPLPLLLRRGWTSAKVWWNRDVVLGEKSYPTLSEGEVARLGWRPAAAWSAEADRFKLVLQMFSKALTKNDLRLGT